MKGKASIPNIPDEQVDMHKTLRKIDWRLFPFLGTCYLLAFLDRANIANARISNKDTGDNLDASLGLTEDQVQLCVGVFFIGYVLLEVPSNIALKKFRPSRWIGRIMFTWGLVGFMSGFVQDFWGLLVCRLLLGVFEAGFFPGVLFYLTFWYTKEEMSVRIAMFYVFSTVSGITSGLLGYGISFMNGFLGLQGWRWIFIIGVPSIIMGIAALFVLPDYPESCHFLSLQEKDEITTRLLASGASRSSESTFDWDQFYDIISSPITYLLCLTCVFQALCFYSFTFSFPSILVALGYHDLTAQLMSVPPYAVAFVGTLVVSKLADLYHKRLFLVLLFCAIRIMGFVGMMMASCPNWKYAFGILSCFGCYSSAPALYAWMFGNHRGATRIAVLSAMVVASGSVSGIFNSYLYPKSHAPHFLMGNILNMVFAGLSGVCVAMAHYLIVNKSKQTGDSVLV